jgi:tetratricopeptide (TPR) repeat protein
MYEKNSKPNFLAAGVCYNNIANLYLKNGKYELAYKNYQHALTMGKNCLSNYQRKLDKGQKKNK